MKPTMAQPRIDWHIQNLEGVKDEFYRTGLPDIGDAMNNIQTLLETHRKKAPKTSSNPKTKSINGRKLYWSDTLASYVTIPEE
jgi:hypothetical protein